jgi:sec-independent protein translocase protein TatA
MGLGGISMWQLLIVLLIVVVIFGTARLRSIGGDLGGAVKGFRKAMSDAENDVDEPAKKLDEPDAEFSEAHAKEAEKNHS